MTGLEDLPFLGETGHVISSWAAEGRQHCSMRWPALFGAGAAGARLHHDPHPASERELRPDEAARDALWQAGTYAVAGVPAEGGKLTMPPYLDDWMARPTLFCLRLTARSTIPARHRPLMSRCSCGQATSCWRQPGCRRWENHFKTSASASKRPAPCWPCCLRRP